MTSLAGNVEDSIGVARANVRVSFRPIGDTRVRDGSFVPPLSVSVLSDSSGDFSVDLQDGSYEIRFDGRGPLMIVVPDDDSITYNPAELVVDSTGQTLVIPITGLNYLFSDDTYLYLRNLSTGLWHQWYVTGSVAPASNIGESASPDAATAITVSGANYRFGSDSTLRLKNTDTSNYSLVYATGLRGFESLNLGADASLTAASASFTHGTNFRVVDRLLQFSNTTLGKWATPYVAGISGGESLTLYPSVT